MSEECLEYFTQEAKNFGLTIVANEQYKGTDTDVTVQLNRIMAAKPSAIWVIGYAHQGAIVAKNAKSLGIKIPLLGDYAFVTETWIRLSEGAAEGWYGCIVTHQLGELMPPWVSTSPIVRAYAEAYRKRFGEGITNTSGTTYDAVYIIAAGLKNVGEEPNIVKRREKLAHEISNLRNFFCLSGPYYLSPDNHNGIGEWGVSIVKIVNGKMVLE
jgi:branched-chain amino acid transport system substrate-binding protein